MNRKLFSNLKDGRFELLNIFLGEDSFVARLEMSATNTRNGEQFAMELLEHWTICDGKIVSIKPFYFDTARLGELL